MEELPEIRTTDVNELPDSPEPVPDKTAAWLLKQQTEAIAPETVAAKPNTMAYELDISPGNIAKVEVEEMAESDFDRHEVLSEAAAESHDKMSAGMIPLSEVLATHPKNPNTAKTPPSARNNQHHNTLLQRRSYRQAIAIGVVGGLIVVSLLIYMYR